MRVAFFRFKKNLSDALPAFALIRTHLKAGSSLTFNLARRLDLLWYEIKLPKKNL